jgi:serine/threonine protein phosphatase PrpC
VNFKDGFQHAALTDVGMRRTSNQDAYAVQLADSPELWTRRGHLFVVADGMGGHAGGELASKLAVEGIPFLYHKHGDLAPPEALLRAIAETNSEVNRRGSANIDFRDMGTTTSALLILPQGALVAHIGDSRVYRLRGDKLHQLTFDHSVDWELKASGAVKEGSELAALVPKNQITRSLGPHPSVQTDLEGPYPTEVGDIFLLCSDGLVRKVEDDEVASILASLSPKEAVQALVDLANVRGGPDNITAIVVRIADPSLTTNDSGAPPLNVQAGEKAKPIHPAFIVVVVACFLAALVLGFAQQWLAAGVAGLGALVAFVIMALQSASGSGRYLIAGQRIGRGPYTETVITSKANFLEKLFAAGHDLREAAEEGQWEIDWNRFDQLRRSAEAARDSGDWQSAVRDGTRAISFLLQELRHQTPKKASDSALEY